MKMAMLLTLILSISAFSSCQSTTGEKTVNTRGPAVQSEIKQTTVTQAKNAVEEKDVQFIDVRTEDAFASGHAPKAVHFPLGALEKDLVKLDKDKPVYVICQTERRSQKGAEIRFGRRSDANAVAG